MDKIEPEIFNKSSGKIVFGYMPADGSDPKPEFNPYWQELANKHNAELVYVDNSKKPSEVELQNISRVNSLSITGGNVFALLHNLRKNGFDKIILELFNKDNFIYSGFSAGAVIVTPDIRIAGCGHGWSFGYDENNVNIKDTRALNLVDFEILPHYTKADKTNLTKYQEKYSVKVRQIADSEYLIFEI
jgi:dipeptidase E